MNDDVDATYGEVEETSGIPKTGVFLSETIRDTSSPEAREEIRFTWPTIRAGDCELRSGSNLTIVNDGTAHWRAIVSSTSGDDSWLSTFEFFDNHMVSLWKFGHISSPSLPRFDPIDWFNDNQLFFPAYIFPSIAQVSMLSRC